jgi:sucrose-6-phosphate hydrolase SacC (GH32 family)
MQGDSLLTGDHRDSSEGRAGAFERPRVHCTPPSGWLSDPNGLVHADGTFHLYYQHHPHDISWGPMHWGHATSTDLVHWRHHPVALTPDDRGTIFSGSAVVDDHDTAGLGADTLIAAFTYHRDGTEEQGLAWSHDGGNTFTKHPAPILEAPTGEPDFRDPKILRYADGAGHWVMLLAVGHAVWIYTSTDLWTWTRTDVVADVFGATGVWETPELLRFDVDGGVQWVLVVSMWDGAPAGGSGVQAVVGVFDGSTFTPSGDAFWVDHGPAFYAPQAWNSAPDGRQIWIGWMANWHTVDDFPAAEWRGQMSIPREVTLRACESGYRLVQTPVPELDRYRDRSLVASGVDVERLLDATLALAAPALDLTIGAAARADVIIRCERGGQIITIRLNVRQREVAVAIGDQGAGEVTHRGPLTPDDNCADLRVLLDAASVEVFAGATTITAQVRNAADPWSVSVRSAGSAMEVEHLELHTLDGADPQAPIRGAL